jgi:hypothetical protein
LNFFFKYLDMVVLGFWIFWNQWCFDFEFFQIPKTRKYYKNQTFTPPIVQKRGKNVRKQYLWYECLFLSKAATPKCKIAPSWVNA